MDARKNSPRASNKMAKPCDKFFARHSGESRNPAFPEAMRRSNERLDSGFRRNDDLMVGRFRILGIAA
jgi:hypothetical protein